MTIECTGQLRRVLRFAFGGILVLMLWMAMLAVAQEMTAEVGIPS